MDQSSSSKHTIQDAREIRGKQAKELRQTSHRFELTQHLRSIFVKVKEENTDEKFRKALASGDWNEIRNESVALKRMLDLDAKLKRLSSNTLQHGYEFLESIQPYLEAKKKAEQLQKDLKQYQKAAPSDNLPPREQLIVRDLVIALRMKLHEQDSFLETALQSLQRFSEDRCKDIGQEASLQHSCEFYLQCVDSPQRARIETQMKGKMENMPFERRIEALQIFIQTLVKISPSVRHAEVGRCIETAQHFLNEHHVGDAVQELQKALEYGQNVEIYLKLADCWKLQGNRKEEINALKHVIAGESGSIEPMLRLARIYEDDGDIISTFPIYEDILDRRPDRFLLLTHAARLAFEQKQWPLAIEWFTRILKSKPRSRKTMMRLGVALVQTGQIHRGVTLLQECKRWGMQEAIVELHLGIGYRSQGHFSEARTAFQQAAELAPNDPDILHWMALSYFESGEYDEAERDCRRLLHQNKNPIEGTILLARILNRLGEHQQALELLSPIRESGRRGARLESGLAWLALDRGEEAYEAAKKLIEEDPADPEARDLMAQSCIQTGRFEESFHYLAADSDENPIPA